MDSESQNGGAKPKLKLKSTSKSNKTSPNFVFNDLIFSLSTNISSSIFFVEFFTKDVIKINTKIDITNIIFFIIF